MDKPVKTTSPATDPGLFHHAVYLTGPTAVGKTAVGIALAQRLDAEIIALDSMTLYRGMDIGTAKPTVPERAGVPHHLIDVLEPSESASVADYRRWAEAVLIDLRDRGRTALFVGGTPLYLKALLRGLAPVPDADPELRARLDRLPSPHDELRRLDPETARRLHPNDRRRAIRALEVLERTGTPLSVLQREHDRPALGVAVFALDRPRAELHQRIEARVEQMMRDGFLDEVRRLNEAPTPMGPTARQAVGYAEALDLIEGRYPHDEAVRRIQARTRQFAKRQLTWFRALEEVRTWPVAPGVTAEQVASSLAQALNVGQT